MTIVLDFTTVNDNGSISAKAANPAVSNGLLQEIHTWREEGASDMDIITRLRQRTVPAGHSFRPWCPGEPGRQCYGVYVFACNI